MKFLIAVVFASLAVAARADNFRCGKWIASADLSVSELRAKCGEPASKETRTEDVVARNAAGYTYKTGQVVVIETWTYHRGSGASPMIVTIIDGRIDRIERAQ
jgi:hypothetical protein